MSATITNFVVGLVVGVVARQLVLWWQRSRDAVRIKLLAAEDYIEHGILKDKWNIELPDSWHNTCVSIIDNAVAFVDSYAGSRDFWVKFIKYAQTTPAAKIQIDLTAALEKLKSNIEKGLPNVVPDELKPLYNEFKEQTAVNIATNKIEAIAVMTPHASMLAPSAATPVPPKENIIEAIKATVAAKKVNEEQKPVTAEDLNKMIAASELRQQLLSKNTK